MKIVATLAVVSLLLLYVWERVDIVQVGYRIEQLKAKKVALERERAELRLKVATLTAPERVAKAAERIGMVAPQQGQLRLVKLDGAAPVDASRSTTEIRVAKNDLLRAVR